MLGHEVAGTIAEVGEDVAGFGIGDRVYAGHHVPCFTCEHCVRGHHSSCAQFKSTNFDPGGFAEYFALSPLHVKSNLRRIPAGVTFDQAAMVEPVATVLRGMRRLLVRPGDAAVVMGAGPIGNVWVQALRHMGAGTVIVTDVVEARLRRAAAAGATEVVDASRAQLKPVIDRLTAGRGADVVVVAAGVSSLLQDAVSIAAVGGQVLAFAPLGTAQLIDASRFFNAEISILGARLLVFPDRLRLRDVAHRAGRRPRRAPDHAPPRTVPAAGGGRPDHRPRGGRAQDHAPPGRAMTELTHRRIAVTGAARGIGRAIAHHLVARGAAVALLDSTPRPWRHRSPMPRARPASRWRWQPTSRIPARLQRAADEVLHRLGGPVDTLVINAGISERCAVTELTPERWRRVMGVNLDGSFFTFKAFQRQLLDSQAPRRLIVLVSSGSAFTGTGGGAHYAASKSGQLGLMRALAQELGPRGVTVNAVAPRTINVGILNSLYPTAEALDQLLAGIPVRRLGTVDDVAHAVSFLISDGASYVHGETILVDGGRGLG